MSDFIRIFKCLELSNLQLILKVDLPILTRFRDRDCLKNLKNDPSFVERKVVIWFMPPDRTLIKFSFFIGHSGLDK